MLHGKSKWEEYYKDWGKICGSKSKLGSSYVKWINNRCRGTKFSIVFTLRKQFSRLWQCTPVWAKFPSLILVKWKEHKLSIISRDSVYNSRTTSSCRFVFLLVFKALLCAAHMYFYVYIKRSLSRYSGISTHCTSATCSRPWCKGKNISIIKDFTFIRMHRITFTGQACPL